MGHARRFFIAERPAYVWGDGPLVLLVHGWAGRAGQMAPLGAALGQAGFRALAFDVRGHGEAAGRSTSWAAFLQDIEAVRQELNQPVYACVGHSAGALTLMAARHRGLCAERFVTICAPSHPFPALDFIRRILDPSDGVMEAYQRDLAVQFGCTWEALVNGFSYREAGSETLLIYDVADKVVPPSEGDKLQGLFPSMNLTKLGPAGHTRLLSTPELRRSVLDFLS